MHIGHKRIASTIALLEHLTSTAAVDTVDALGLRREAKVRIAKLVSTKSQA